MEALRKAEEAKRKDTKESDVDPELGRDTADSEIDASAEENAPELEPSEDAELVSHDLQTDFDAALTENRTADDSSDLESEGESLQETISPDQLAEPVSPDGAEIQVENSPWQNLDLHPIQNDGLDSVDHEENEQAAVAALAEPEPEPEPEPVHSNLIDDYADEDETDSEDVDDAEVAAWKSRARKLTSSKDYRKISILVVAILLVAGGALFWFLGSEPEATAPTPNRGFLGGPDPEEVVELEDGQIEGAGLTDDGVSQDSVLAVVGGDQQSSGAIESLAAGVNTDPQIQAASTVSQSGLTASRSEQTQVFRVSSSTRSSELEALRSR